MGTLCGLTLAQIEGALDQGKLYAKMSNGREWQCRRNGRTQTWKRDPSRFRIPVKAGFRATGAVEPHTLHDFVIKVED